MPELPEVETIKQGLMPLLNQKIKQINIRTNKLRYPIDPDLHTIFVDQIITNIQRRAKYLLISCTTHNLIIHLGMSGSITLINNNSELINIFHKHDHIDIIHENYTLRYNDPRKFGCILWTKNTQVHPLMIKLGHEPLSDEFNANYLFNKLNNSPIKKLIMNQAIVTGVGNIYASEALFQAKILPHRISKSLNFNEVKKLVTHIKQTLLNAINKGGSTLKDYKHIDGNIGYFQNEHKVYGKTNEPCCICKTPIKQLIIGQRNSFYCSTCQQ